MLQCLNDEGVKYMLIGAFALAAHGYLRATMDMDLWVMPSPDNAKSVWRALQRFGAPLHDLSLDDLQRDDTIFQIGVSPRRIDIITGASGIDFATTFQEAERTDMDGIAVRVPSLSHLIQNKKAAGRTKDLADVEELERMEKRG